jgi:hypothetical protein
MACSSPFVLCLWLDLRVFKHLRPPLPVSRKRSTPLVRFHATLAFCLSKIPSPSCLLSSRLKMQAETKTPRLSFLALQHFPRLLALFFHFPVRGSVQPGLPGQLEVSHPGFGYPLCDVSSKSLKKFFSTSNAPGLHPSEFFSHRMIGTSFPMFLSAHALGYKTHC